MLQIVFSHGPPLYDLLDNAEFRTLHTPCFRYDSETGIFTVPEDGCYFVSTFLRGGAGDFGLFDIELNDEKL